MKIKTSDIIIRNSIKVKGTYNIDVLKGFLGFNFSYKLFRKHVPENELFKEIENAKNEMNRWCN